MGVYLDIHKTLGNLFGLYALFLGDSFRQKLQVHIISHSLHVSVLTSSENTSRTSYLKVSESYAEAAAELCELAHCVQPLGSYLGQDLVTLIGEIRISAAV